MMLKLCGKAEGISHAGFMDEPEMTGVSDDSQSMLLHFVLDKKKQVKKMQLR